MAEPTVASITPHIRALEAPKELRRLPSWCIWRYEQHAGEPKPRKVPFCIDGSRRHGRQGSPEDRARLVSFAAATEAAARKGFDGVGLALLPGQNICALDFDHVVDPVTGAIPPEVMAIIGDTYTEFSPSGTGLRAFVKGDLGNHKSQSAPGQPWGAEVFSSSGFVTFTGQKFWTTDTFGNAETIAPISPALEALATARFGPLRSRDGAEGTSDPFETFTPPLGLPEAEIVQMLSDLDPSMSRDGWIRVGMALHHETDGEGFVLWDDWSSGGAQYPGTEALESQWSSFDRPSSRQPVTMASVKKMVEAVRAQVSEQSIVDVAAVGKAEIAAMLDPEDTKVSTPDGWTGRFPIHDAGSFAARPEPEWIIKGVIPKADLGVIFGPSGSGKSFVACEMGLCVARGVEWQGRRVKQGRVLYLVAEGGGGVPQRLKAYASHHEVDMTTIPFGIMHGVPNLLIEDDVTDIMAALVAARGVDLIIIDTFAQVTGGANENSAEDMGLALRHARSIREMTDAMVLLVHHSGKDVARGARGWSGIRAAADVELEIVRFDEEPVRTLRISKQKDGRDDLQWGFALQEVIVGLDRDGEEMTSVVVVEAEIPVREEFGPEKSTKAVGAWQQLVIDTMNETDVDQSAMSLETFTQRVIAMAPQPGPEERDTRRQNVQRAVKALSKGDGAMLSIENGMVTMLRFD